MLRFLYYLIATGFGVGFFPVAPGTLGSLLSLFFFYFIFPDTSVFILLILFLLFWLGVFVSTKIEKERGEDPSQIVVDEMLGMGISLLFLPKDWRLYFIAFLLFRLFDIWKPPPIDQSQRLPAGLGVMSDDLLAGIYALFFVQITRIVFFS